MKKLLASALIIACSLSVFACSKTNSDTTPPTTSAPAVTRATQPGVQIKTYGDTPDFLLERVDKEFPGNILDDNHILKVKSTPEEFRELVFSYLGGEFHEPEEGEYGDLVSDEFVIDMSFDPDNCIEASCRLVEYKSYHAELYFIFHRTETLRPINYKNDYWEIYYDGDPGYSMILVLDKTGKVAFETNADPVFVASIMGFNVTEYTIAGSINGDTTTNLPVPFLSDDGNGGVVTSVDVTDMIKPFSIYDLNPGQTVGADLEILTERMLRHGFRLAERTDDQAIYRFNNVTIAFDIKVFGTDMQMTGFHIYLEEEQEEFTDEELIEMAKKHYESVNGVVPPYIDIEHTDPGLVSIHLYDIVEITDDNGEVQSMTQTYDWYTIDTTLGRGTNFKGEDVDLTEFS